MTPTLSGLGLVATCPGSASLPHQRTRSAPADFGNAVHEATAERIRLGGDPDVESIADKHDLSEEHAGMLGYIDKHFRPPVPAGALVEVPLGYWPDGTVRRVEGGQGRYRDDGQILSGTFDCLWAEPAPLVPGHWRRVATDPWDPECPKGSTLFVLDWKTGDEENVSPVRRNWQLRAGALLAARWTGAARVIPAIVYVNPRECAEWLREHPGEPYPGRWEIGEALDAKALAAIERDMRGVLARSGTGERSDNCFHNAHEHCDACGCDCHDPPLVTGPHCAHCNASAACPALARQALTLYQAQSPFSPEGKGDVLTVPGAARLASLIGPARKVLDDVTKALRAHGEAHGPIPLGDGRVYGPAEEEVEKLDPAATAGALEAAGLKVWPAMRATKDGVRDACKGAPRGTYGRVLEAVRDAGGATVERRQVWRVRQGDE